MVGVERSDVVNIAINNGNHDFSNEDIFRAECNEYRINKKRHNDLLHEMVITILGMKIPDISIGR